MRYIALVIMATMVLSLLSPLGSLAETPKDKTQKLMKVRVRMLSPETVQNNIFVNGRTQASRTVEVKAEVEGRVSEILIERGKRMDANAVIARLDVNERKVNVEKAREILEQRKIEYNVAKNLTGKGFNSAVKLAETKANLESARAGLKVAEIEFSNVEIKSPFEGVLEERSIEVGSYLQPGAMIGKVIDLDPIFVVGSISEHKIHNVSIGRRAFVELPNGEEIEGEIHYIATMSDSLTRTFRIEVKILNEDFRIIDGLTSRIRIPLDELTAYKISPAILSLDDDGNVGVKTVGSENIVLFNPVKIVANKEGAVWVTGLKGTVRAITVGQDFVKSGQKVIAQESNNSEGLL